MQVKIDTKEKFTVVTPILTQLSDNIAADWVVACRDCLQKEVKNIILRMDEVPAITKEGAQVILELAQQFYEANASFVICGLQDNVENSLDQMEILEMLNVTPTESEAWDIVQMEEIERELLDSDDFEFDKNE